MNEKKKKKKFCLFSRGGPSTISITSFQDKQLTGLNLFSVQFRLDLNRCLLFHLMPLMSLIEAIV